MYCALSGWSYAQSFIKKIAVKKSVPDDWCYVYNFDKPNEPFEYYVNPKIVWRSNLIRKGAEGCLSIPDERGDVYRNYTIQISYFDANGDFKQEVIEGFTAVIFQHEIDHLNGILFTERMMEQQTFQGYPIGEGVHLSLEKKVKR